MLIREMIEDQEKESLNVYATLSIHSHGRDVPEPQCDIRPVFQRDRDRILHSKSFRRLKNKTQVFLDPKGDHYRTRLSHTLEVSQTARTIAKALRFNEDLVEAIALGHDLGHTPFGHAGERTLDKLCEGGFEHNVQSVRIVEKLEQNGRGLNLTWEVRDGILNHQTSTIPHTPEGKIVRLSDKIAYTHHDMDDAIRANLLTEDDIPQEIRNALGATTKDRLNNIIHDVIEHSLHNMKIMDVDCRNDLEPMQMSAEMEEAMFELRQFMFDRIYTNPVAKSEEEKAQLMLRELFHYYMEHTNLLQEKYQRMIAEGEKTDRVVCDYIAGMTDTYAIAKFNELFMPMSWQVEGY